MTPLTPEQEADERYPQHVGPVHQADSAITRRERTAYRTGHASGYAKAVETAAVVAESWAQNGDSVTLEGLAAAIRGLAAPADAEKGG